MIKKCIAIVLGSLIVSVAAADETVDCSDAITTREMNKCMSNELNLAKAELDKYLKATYKHQASDPELIASIKTAQKDWQVYLSSHCDSIYTQWRDGTIRGTMSIACRTQLTKQRTHDLWASFLTYMDSTPPVLPEPKMQ